MSNFADEELKYLRKQVDLLREMVVAGAIRANKLEASILESAKTQLRLHEALVTQAMSMVNLIAMNGARHEALRAYVMDQSPADAWDAARDQFRLAEPQVYDPTMWGVRPDWLTAVMRRD